MVKATKIQNCSSFLCDLGSVTELAAKVFVLYINPIFCMPHGKLV